MKDTSKRFLSVLLTLAMLLSMLPMGFAMAATDAASTAPDAAQTAPVIPSDTDYAAADAIFAQITAMENEPAKKGSSQAQLTDAAAAIVEASDSYVQGSLERNGDAFTWMTKAGIRCRYSPRMNQILADMEAPEAPMPDGAYNEPVATKGGWPSGNQVYLVGPFYGYDADFTDQYKNEASAIATAIGDTDGYTLYSGTAATVDAVANAVSNGAVVIFDSHGDTDYANGDDYVTGATSSYLCLKTSSGLTTQDYADGADYAGGIAYVNGTVIANHMTSNSPSGMLWMAICLGMATNTMCEPLRAKGVEVVYGYSQSVTFAGDYLYEETFWDQMYQGATVASAISTMKSTWGNWDWSTKIASYYGYSDGYSTISAARSDYIAFPIVVSDEDSHPGQRSGSSYYGADSLQNVNSTYTLFSQYAVDVQVNDSSFGSASVNGNVITAAPAAGYFAQGYTVISGSATVTQNGNSFVVSAQSDCVIQINFAPKTSVTVSFSGAAVSPKTGYAGDAMTLPTVTAPEGFTFLGWMESALTADTTEKPSHYTSSFTPTGNTTLYALYSYVDDNSGTGTGNYVKVTSTPADWSGEYVIVYEDSGYILDGSLTSIDASGNYQSVTISNGTISAEAGDPYKFTISAQNSGYSILSASGLYIGCATNANALNASSDPLENTISLDASGNANIIGSGGAYLRFNGTASRFRYYKSSTYTNQSPVALYLKDGSAGTVYFTGNPTVCEHANTQTIDAVAATCTETGFTAGVYCNDCSSYISGHEVVDALGHSYETEVIAPTITEQGYTIYTCSVCNDSYIGDYTEALGETYTVSFMVPNGVTSIADMSCGKSGITLPTPGNPTEEYSYSFVGWTTGHVDNATQAPTLYSGSYVATQDITLYAVYSYIVGGSGTTDYILTDLADILPTDTVVITVDYNGTVYALTSANGTGKAPTGVIVEVATDGGVTKLSAAPSDSLKWNIGGTAGAYIIYPAGQTGTWLYCTNTNNGVRVGTGSANTFSIVSDYLYNNGQNRYIGVYRTNPDWRCYTSINTNISNQTLGFYVMGEAGTTYYTTIIETSCQHNYESVTVDPTCENAGSTTYTCTACGDSYSEEIAALGHSWNDATCTAPKTCSVCGATEGEALTHNYESVTVDPTCENAGSTTYTCTACGDSYTGDEVASLGHSWNDATCTAPKTCSVCGATEGEALGHASYTYSYDSTNKIHSFTCTVCGEVTTKTATDGKKFAINSAAPVLSDDIILKYRATIPAGFEFSRMEFLFNDEVYTYTDYVVDGERISISFPYIIPQKMGDNICATLYATVDGVEVSVQIASYSMLKYCDNQLKKTSLSDTLRALYSDVLAYGASVQIMMNYKADDLVTGKVTDPASLKPSTFPGLDDSYNLMKRTGTALDNLEVSGVTVMLGSKVNLRYTIKTTDLESFTYKVQIKSREYTFTGADLVPTATADTYYLYFDGAMANELGEKITLTCWDGDTQVSRTVEYSVYTYVYRNYANSSKTEAERNLLMALFNYGESTKNAL